MTFSASLFSAEQILDTASEAFIPLRIVGKRGLPFVFRRYRKRYGIFFGLIIGLAIMFFSQLFVWKISVNGTVELSEKEVLEQLSQVGITVGSFVPDIDVYADANRILMNCKTVSSVAIGINGTHLTVSVLERASVPDIVDTEGYYNVVATHDGVILDVDAAEGTPEISEGEAVFEGQLLINSFIEGTNGTYRPTHARGIVYAAVKETFESRIPFERISKHLTGEVETKRSYSVLGVRLPTFGSETPDFEYFDTVISENIVMLFGFIELPVVESKVVYIEYTPTLELIDATRAEILANEELSDFFGELDLEVLDCKTEFTVDEKNGVCILRADAVLKRDIARELKLDFENQIMPRRLPIARE